LTIRELVDRSVPLVVQRVEANEPFFSLVGIDPSWYLGVACSWSILGPERAYYSEEVEVADFPRIVDLLKGRVIHTLDLGEDLIDPVFYLDGGFTLSLHADTDLDPWVLSFPATELVLVGRAPGLHV
jgi:hypothetical protein